MSQNTSKNGIEVPSQVAEAFELAKRARSNAYAPYSLVKVGAAIKARDCDDLYGGANVEIVVNGASVCAERSAVSTMVSTIGATRELEFVVVSSHTSPALYPCGVCLQVLSEFASPDLDIYIGNRDEIVDKVKLKDLMPHQYSELPKVLPE